MSTRRQIADAARVEHHPDGSRTIWWRDGIRRTYSKQTIASMFLEAVEKGTTNPLLDRLTTPEERREMYEGLDRINQQLAELVAAGDTKLVMEGADG